MSNKTYNLIAIALLIIMGVSAYVSMKEISATTDEIAHIPAGYSYLTQQDYRTNPEHPPLVKDAAALPLLFTKPNFPSDEPVWEKVAPSLSIWWGQFQLGREFIYHSGNNPESLVSLARIPMIAILLLLGGLLYYWIKKLKNNGTALLVLALFSFSPAFLAHGRLVTNDVGATFGFVLGIMFWLRWLNKPNWKNIILAGLAIGTALLIKFSLALIIPLVIITTLLYVWLYKKSFIRYLALGSVVGLIALTLIWIVYQFHVINYPIGKQLSDTKTALDSVDFPLLDSLCLWMADKPGLRAIGHYLLGLLMATQRTAQGNPTYYLMGKISNNAWQFYFPLVYLLKVPLAFHFLTLLTIGGSTYYLGNFSSKKFWSRTKNCLKRNFVLVVSILFIVIYWFTSMKGNLNIGVRHILPTFPFIYLLVAAGVEKITNKIKKHRVKTGISTLTIGLLIWYVISSVAAFPHYLPYFNATVDQDKGYEYAIDSNYDWGQDLKRLSNWVEKHKVEKIYIDYFGQGSLDYYLDDKYERWKMKDPDSKLPSEAYLAVSVNKLQRGKAQPTPDYKGNSGYYDWLKDDQLIDKAGKSIFIYRID